MDDDPICLKLFDDAMKISRLCFPSLPIVFNFYEVGCDFVQHIIQFEDSSQRRGGNDVVDDRQFGAFEQEEGERAKELCQTHK